MSYCLVSWSSACLGFPSHLVVWTPFVPRLYCCLSVGLSVCLALLDIVCRRLIMSVLGLLFCLLVFWPCLFLTISVNEALQKDPYISQPVHSITVICSFFSVLLLVLVLFYIFLFLKCPFFVQLWIFCSPVFIEMEMYCKCIAVLTFMWFAYCPFVIWFVIGLAFSFFLWAIMCLSLCCVCVYKGRVVYVFIVWWRLSKLETLPVVRTEINMFLSLEL